MSSPTQIAHVVLGTRQFDLMADWYVMFLDATLRFKNDALAFISFDDEHHRVALSNMNVIDPGGALSAREGTLRHVAYTFPNVGELLINYERIRDAGYRPYWCLHHGMTLSLYYADPDGNQMECQVDVFDDADDANDFMMGALFLRNPIGVEFDPEDLLARFRSGEPEESLLRYDECGPISPIRRAGENGVGEIVTIQTRGEMTDG